MGQFVKTGLRTVINISAIYTVHYFEYAKNFKFFGEKHDFWEIVYVDKGEVFVISENIGYTLTQGMAIFHKPNEYHNIWTNDVFANVSIITFECNDEIMDLFKGLIVMLSAHERNIFANILKISKKTFLEPLNILSQARLIKSTSCFYGNEQFLKNYLEIMLLSIAEREERLDSTAWVSDEAVVQHRKNITEVIISVLKDNIYSSMTFSELAKKACFSKSYITKLFKADVGTGVMECYLNLKIEEAKKLISEKNLSVTEIASKLCFSSVHYFSRIFKIKTGMSPKQYGKSIQSLGIL